MAISESKFRQILREEARRVLREGESTVNEGFFDQARNKIGAVFGQHNPQTAAERFAKKVPAFMEAYEIYKKLKSEYSSYHRTDSGHRSVDAFGGFTPETVQNVVRQMARIADRETDLKRFYKEVDVMVGPRKTYVDLEAALVAAGKLMSAPNPRKAIGEEYFNLSAKHRADMDAHDREMDAERARKRGLDRRGGDDTSGSSPETPDFWERGREGGRLHRAKDDAFRAPMRDVDDAPRY